PRRPHRPLRPSGAAHRPGQSGLPAPRRHVDRHELGPPVTDLIALLATDPRRAQSAARILLDAPDAATRVTALRVLALAGRELGHLPRPLPEATRDRSGNTFSAAEPPAGSPWSLADGEALLRKALVTAERAGLD